MRFSTTVCLSWRSELSLIVEIVGVHIICWKISNVLVKSRKGVYEQENDAWGQSRFTFHFCFWWQTQMYNFCAYLVPNNWTIKIGFHCGAIAINNTFGVKVGCAVDSPELFKLMRTFAQNKSTNSRLQKQTHHLRFASRALSISPQIYSCNSLHDTCAQFTTNIYEGCHQTLHLSPPLQNCQ